MSIVDLTAAKAHLKIMHADDDAEIQVFLDAAETVIAKYLRCDLVADFPDGLPEPIQVAALCLVGRFYEDRAVFEEGEMPGLVKIILADYRVYS